MHLAEMYKSQKRLLSIGFDLKPCHACFVLSHGSCHPCYCSCCCRLDRITTLEIDIELDFGKVRSGSFLKTLTYFRKKLLRGKYETIKESK